MAEEPKPDTMKLYTPSEKEVRVINHTYERFRRMQEERDKVRREFDGMTLKSYVNMSMDAYNGIVSDELKATKDDWQSIVWDHKTRGKVKTIVAMIIGTRPFMSITGKSQKSHEYASDLFEVYEDAWKNENGAYKLYLQALSACTKGTVIVEEAYVEEKVKRKEVISVNQQTGKVTCRVKDVIKGGVGQVKGDIVPLLAFYPNENSAEIEHDCAVVRLFTEDSFKQKFGKYPNSEFVKKGVFASGFNIEDIAYKSISDRKETLIEVLRYYNEDTDEYVILANGFWLNPQEGDETSPIPFDHKRLPFTKTVFELADEECFYGKSLPDLMRGEQDTDNALLRLMIDQEILALNKPILLGMGMEIESFQLYPGKPIKLTGPMDEVREMQMTGATQSGFQLLQLLKNNSDVNTSIDPTSQGVSSGGRKTARETVILDENSKRNSGPFHLHIYKLLFDRAKLRVENIKQFYTSPVHYSVLKDKYGQPITVGGKQKKVKEYRTVTVAKPGKAPQWVSVRPEMKGCDFDVRFVEDYELNMNSSARMEAAKALLDEAKSNPLISADAATIEYLEAFRKNPDIFYLKPTPEAMQFQASQGVPQQNQPV
jgi:hypothetical protein